MNLFETYELRDVIKSYNGISFSLAHSFLSVLDGLNDVLYYVLEHNANSILIYNEYWEYQRKVSVQNQFVASGLSYGVQIENLIYLPGNEIINIYDKYLNLDKSVNVNGVNRGIQKNKQNGYIYVTNLHNQIINVFSDNFILIKSISTSFKPWIIAEHNGLMIVTEDSSTGNIHFIDNDSITETIKTNCLSRINSILFDEQNHMTIVCDAGNLYIYDVDEYVYSGLEITTCANPFYSNFDSKGRLVVICMKEINIYY